jgi:hypothetical protein
MRRIGMKIEYNRMAMGGAGVLCGRGYFIHAIPYVLTFMLPRHGQEELNTYGFGYFLFVCALEIML